MKSWRSYLWVLVVTARQRSHDQMRKRSVRLEAVELVTASCTLTLVPSMTVQTETVPKLQRQSRSTGTLQFTTLDADRGSLRLAVSPYVVPGTVIMVNLPVLLCMTGDKPYDDNAILSSVRPSITPSQEQDVTTDQVNTHPFIFVQLSLDESGTDPMVKILGYLGRSYDQTKPDFNAKSTFFSHDVKVGAYHIPVATTAAPLPTHLRLQTIPDGVPIAVDKDMWFLAHPVTFFI